MVKLAIFLSAVPSGSPLGTAYSTGILRSEKKRSSINLVSLYNVYFEVYLAGKWGTIEIPKG